MGLGDCCLGSSTTLQKMKCTPLNTTYPLLQMPYGRSNLILPYFDAPDGTPCIQKIKAQVGTPCHDTLTQLRIHMLAQRILTQTPNYDHLRVPRLYDDPHHKYIMERVDTTQPLWLGDSLSTDQYSQHFIEDVKRELRNFWNDMWNHKFAAWDFQLFIQPDLSVVLLGFDKFGFERYTESASLDISAEMPVPVPREELFLAPCFPPYFDQELRPRVH